MAKKKVVQQDRNYKQIEGDFVATLDCTKNKLRCKDEDLPH